MLQEAEKAQRCGQIPGPSQGRWRAVCGRGRASPLNLPREQIGAGVRDGEYGVLLYGHVPSTVDY